MTIETMAHRAHPAGYSRPPYHQHHRSYEHPPPLQRAQAHPHIQTQAHGHAPQPQQRQLSFEPTPSFGAPPPNGYMPPQPLSPSDAGDAPLRTLARVPDYRFNLYVSNLSPTTTNKTLFDLFVPFGYILSCKVIFDKETGVCKGGFVLYDNEESCKEARRDLTRQGLYVAVAHDSVSIKNIHVSETPTMKTRPSVPECQTRLTGSELGGEVLQIDNSNDFPSLSAAPKTNQAKKKKSKEKREAQSPTKLQSISTNPQANSWSRAHRQTSDNHARAESTEGQSPVRPPSPPEPSTLTDPAVSPASISSPTSALVKPPTLPSVTTPTSTAVSSPSSYPVGAFKPESPWAIMTSATPADVASETVIPNKPFLEPAPTHANEPHVLGNSFVDFDSGFLSSNHHLFSGGLVSFANPLGRRSSFLESPKCDKGYGSVDDIDRIMSNMMEAHTLPAIPQVSTNTEGARPQERSVGALISNTAIEDFMLEDRPRQEACLYFNNLSDELTYQQLFELCSQYGSLVLKFVDIRYIHLPCHGQGRVTFESHADSETALKALRALNYDVRRDESERLFQRQASIDDQLYSQYYEQYQAMLRNGHQDQNGLSQEEVALKPLASGYPYSAPSVTSSFGLSALPHVESSYDNIWQNVGATTAGCSSYFPEQCIPTMTALTGPLDEIEIGGRTPTHESSSMTGLSSQRVSVSPSSSTSSPHSGYQDWIGESPVTGATKAKLPAINTVNHQEQNEAITGSSDIPQSPSSPLSAMSPTSSKLLSYSAILKAPPPKNALTESHLLEAKEAPYLNPPSQDLRRRGNTSSHLDEKEYGLNLYLKNLEPTMDEYKLYDICVKFGDVMSCRTITTHHGVCTGLGFVMFIHRESAERAIAGLNDLGYYAEVAVQSATNKLRCKVKSDTLFLQNIPTYMSEHKLMDLFRPYKVMNCNILEDHKSDKGKGVAFLKMRDIKTAERFIEEYHGRVLGKDWKLPLQVSPARH